MEIVEPAGRDGLKVSDNLFSCVPGAFWVESPVPPGRMRTLIHPGPVSPGQVTIDVTHFATPVLMRADGGGGGGGSPLKKTKGYLACITSEYAKDSRYTI